MGKYVTLSRGEHRAVVAIPALGIALKFPRIGIKIYQRGVGRREADLVMTLEDVRDELAFSFKQLREDPRFFFSAANWSWLIDEIRNFWARVRPRVRAKFFWALADNRRERRYYKNADSTQKQLLQPTYFSLLGLVNIQKFGQPSTEDGRVVKATFVVLVGSWQAQVESHHLDYANNFCDFSEGLKFLDYGSKGVQRFLDWHAIKLLNFDLELGRAKIERDKTLSHKEGYKGLCEEYDRREEETRNTED